jgi:N-acetyl-alpha-D-glucosaminyl L-malate synthase BshA
MIGDGPDRQSAEDLARCLGIYQDTRFLGKQEQISEILSIADLFLLPSQSESFGLSALEAMSCMVPLISSNSGGIPEININGVTGYMSEIGDVDDMAKNAINILSNDARLAEFKKNAFTQALKFEKQNIIPLYEELYREVTSVYQQRELAH